MNDSDDSTKPTTTVTTTPAVTPQASDFVGRDEPDPDDDWVCLTPTHHKFGNKLSVPAVLTHARGKLADLQAAALDEARRLIVANLPPERHEAALTKVAAAIEAAAPSCEEALARAMRERVGQQ